MEISLQTVSNKASSGQIKKMNNKLLKNILKSWVIPLVIALLLFFIARPTFAQLLDNPILEQPQDTGDIETGVETVEGYSHVYILSDNKKTFITQGNTNSRPPDSAGEYLTWATDINGAGQVFLYHLPTETITQITHSGTNLEPKVSKAGSVTWEGWVDENWQVFLFDGASVNQITQGETSVNPDIEGEYLIYSRRSLAGTWRSVVYSMQANEAKDVGLGVESKSAKLDQGKILLGPENKREFPLRAEDLFVLDLEPLTSINQELVIVSEEEILEELLP